MVETPSYLLTYRQRKRPKWRLQPIFRGLWRNQLWQWLEEGGGVTSYGSGWRKGGVTSYGSGWRKGGVTSYGNGWRKGGVNRCLGPPCLLRSNDAPNQGVAVFIEMGWAVNNRFRCGLCL